ncbi:MAG: nucleotidyltransferase family protein [Rhodospirillaceae bacterium]|nr:MAG: nucleotidyltransferase family protein [Rhodospirillaceae bacterium]
MGLRDWWLTSGCIVQTVWNLRCGRPAGEGINDYDVVYFADDPSWEAEDQVIGDAKALFADLPAKVEVRNQARVHLWYPEKFGISYSALTTASEGILRFPSTTTAVGLKRTGDDFLDVYAPFGLGNVWDMIVKPNRALPMAEVYKEKSMRWQRQWPRLVVRPWVVEPELE